jgi:hypothetical protein
MFQNNIDLQLAILDGMRASLDRAMGALESHCLDIYRGIDHIECFYENGKSRSDGVVTNIYQPTAPATCAGLREQIDRVEKEFYNMRCNIALFERRLLITGKVNNNPTPLLRIT